MSTLPDFESADPRRRARQPAYAMCVDAGDTVSLRPSQPVPDGARIA